MILDLDTLSLTNEPTIIISCISREFPSVGYQIGYSTSPITEENWDEAIKADAIFEAGYHEDVPDHGYIKFSNLDFPTTYYFAAKAYDEDGNFSEISKTVYVTTTDEIKSWNASSFDEMTDKGWWDLNPVLPPGSTSQVFLAYDPVGDMLMTWGGHLVSGGYPQIDEIYTYNIGDISQENTWKLEDIRLANSSDKPVGGCCTGGTYDVANEVMFKRGQHRVDSYEYYRKSNLEGWPWVYDGNQQKWFDMKSFEYMSGGNDGAGVTYDSKNQLVLILDSKHDNYHRTAVYDAYANKVTRIPINSWSALGGKRSDMGLVYDSKRNRYVVVGGVLLGVEGIRFRHTDVWTFDLTDKKWVEEEGVINSEILPTNGWSASDATYDSIHDKIILFLGFNVSGKQDFDGRYLLVFAYDPDTKTWERMPDKPGHFVGGRPMDLNVVFSEKHNACLSLESARPSYSGQGLYSTTMAFRYSTDIPTQTDPNIVLRTDPPVIREGYVFIQNSDCTKVAWVPSDNRDIVGYNIYRSECSFEVYPINGDVNEPGEPDQYARPTIKRITKPIETDYIKINSGLVTTNEYEDTIDLVNPDIDVTYPYKVCSYIIKAVNAAGIEGGWSPYCLTIANPPTGLKIDEDDNNFYLSWVPPHNGEGIKGYRIYITRGSHGIDEITDQLTENDIIKQDSVIIPKDLDIIAGNQRFYVVAVDNLDQEGIPSAGIWGNRPYSDVYDQYYLNEVDGDLNNDGVVNIIDYSKIINALGKSNVDEGYNSKADTNNDGKTSYSDFVYWYNIFKR